MLSDDAIRVAVLGAGNWARQYHLPCLKRLASEIPLQITGIWNRSVKSAELAASEFGIDHVYPTLAAVLADPAIDCFVVIVNSGAISEIVRALLPRGLPMFTEKPPGATYEEARELSFLVQVANVVAFNRRYMPINQRFKALVRGIANPYFAECHFYRNERRYEHFVGETGIHAINYMEDLFGPIESVRSEKLRSAGGGRTLASLP